MEEEEFRGRMQKAVDEKDECTSEQFEQEVCTPHPSHLYCFLYILLNKSLGIFIYFFSIELGGILNISNK